MRLFLLIFQRRGSGEMWNIWRNPSKFWPPRSSWFDALVCQPDHPEWCEVSSLCAVSTMGVRSNTLICASWRAVYAYELQVCLSAASLPQSILLLSVFFIWFHCSIYPLFTLLFRVKKLKNTPIYIKPQLTSDAGTCRVNVLVGIRNDPAKPIDNITVRFHLPSCVASAELTSNYGTVNVLADKVRILFLNGAMPLDGSCWNSIIFCFFGFVNISM